MPRLERLFSERRPVFERELESAPDVKSAHDILKRQMSELRRACLDQEEDQARRRELNRLMSAAEAGMSAMLSVSRVDISLKLESRLPAASRRARRGWRAALVLLPTVLCAILGVWLLLDGRLSAMVLALAAAALSQLTSRRIGAPPRALPDVTGEARVDAAELLRRVEHMLCGIDALLEAEAGDHAQPLLLTRELMESLQMLMEAGLTSDGAFALRALPQVMDALGRQGVDAQMYGADNRLHFDLLPAPEGGETIRPALVKDGRVLARGQATTRERADDGR